ncbi:MAG TPA: diaminopimelate decarboxylase [Candidatus Saccharimonadales bacterium]|jgi:diaminopimelate decarboxylase
MTLSATAAHELATQHGTPLYVYDTAGIRARAKELAGLQLPYGLAVRYAVKANPHPQIIKMFAEEGLSFDASSSYEAAELLEQGIAGERISLSSQQPAHNLPELLRAGVQFVATSQHQLELFAAAKDHPGTVGLRVNPGMGNGHNNRLTTGGVGASFGLWHEYLPQALQFAKEQGIEIDRLHVHVGTGGDPSKWGDVLDAGLHIAEQMPDVTSLDIGGGFKIAYTEADTEADMPHIFELFGQKLSGFAQKTGRQLRLEIEPGRWLVAHGGVLITEVVDVVDTGKDGYTFLRTNTGMNDFLRAAMYGAQHRIKVLNDAAEQAEYIVVGHNCETSDILTPAPHDPEGILPRQLQRANIGDLLAVYDTGAYCASMSTKGYNAFPTAKEIFI